MKTDSIYRCYLITNTVNGKQYVGYTKYSLKKRITDHFSKAKTGSPSALHSAIRKYGKASFTIRELSIAVSLVEACKQERTWIKTYDTFDGPGYNMSSGGELSAPSQKPYSNTRRQKLAQSTTEYWKSDEGLKKKEELVKRNKLIQSDRMKAKWQNPTVAMLTKHISGRPKGSKNKLPYPFKGKSVQHYDTTFRSAKEAAAELKVTTHTIHVWCRSKINGWCHPWK